MVWNKVKGAPDNTKDRLRNIHEDVFHFVKCPRGYYYDVDSIRSTPKSTKVINGSVVSATGVSGVRYKRQIELSTDLTEEEKKHAFHSLQKMLDRVAGGEIADFRMIIRGQQRTTHSDSEKLSGRAKELRDKGFYFLKYHPNGSKPSDDGTSSRRTRNSGKLTSLPIPRTFARSRSWPRLRRVAWSSIPSVGRVLP